MFQKQFASLLQPIIVLYSLAQLSKEQPYNFIVNPLRSLAETTVSDCNKCNYCRQYTAWNWPSTPTQWRGT